jgi:hypothetical protein
MVEGFLSPSDVVGKLLRCVAKHVNPGLLLELEVGYSHFEGNCKGFALIPNSRLEAAY